MVKTKNEQAPHIMDRREYLGYTHSLEMEPSEENERNDSIEERPGVDAAKESLERELDKLWDICNVLGILWKKKMAEFGPESEVTEERVCEAIRFLTVTRDTNFRKLKEICEKICEAWGLCGTSIAKVESWSWVFLVLEAENAEQIMHHWSVLATDSLLKAESELSKLLNDRDVKIRKKYNMKKTKLRKMLAETHLTEDDVQFDLNETATTEKYRYKIQKNSIKYAIRDLKEESVRRKELVVRIEMAKKAVHNKSLSPEDKKVMISYAQKTVERMKEKEEEQIHYDGEMVETILTALRNEVDEAVNLQVVETTEELPRTRSGRR